MKKTLLVAMREFVEFLRTKTFWIGILSFPVLIVLSGVLSKWMSKAKDVRRYAVLDHSPGEWLSTEVHKRGLLSALPDGHPLRMLQLPDVSVLALRAVDGAGPVTPPGTQDPAALRKKLDEAIAKLGPKERAAVEQLQADYARDPQGAMRDFQVMMAPMRFQRVRPADLGEDPEAALAAKVNNGELFAYLVVEADPVESESPGRYVSNNPSDQALKEWFERVATEVVRERKIAKLHLSEAQARELLEQFKLADRKVSKTTGKVEAVKGEDRASHLAPMAFVYLLWIALITAAQMLLTNTVEEKSNRIIEVLLSSVSPIQLMAGKIFGIAATGLTLIASWVICALLGTNFMPGLAELNLNKIVGDPRFLASFAAYFLAGYLLFAAILVGLGSVCNSLKEAQTLMQPVFILLIVPLIAMFPIAQDPNGTLAKLLSYIPLFTPFVMMNRAAGPPALHEYVVTSILLVLCILFAFWAAAKIFRIGILMTGKPPRVREILRWLRAPTGMLPQRREPA